MELTPKFEKMHFVVKCQARCQRIHRLGPEDSIVANRNSLAIDFHRAILIIPASRFSTLRGIYVDRPGVWRPGVWLVSFEAKCCDNRVP